MKTPLGLAAVYPKSKMPEPEKLIRLYCGDHQAVGKWVLYKGQKQGRFMVKDKYGRFDRDMYIWHDREFWSYEQLKKGDV